MVAMTIADPWHGPDRLLTVDDLDDLPDDGLRYELDDGMLIVSPAPAIIHGVALSRLTHVLVGACPPDLVVVDGAGITMSKYQYRIPDLTVAPVECLKSMSLEAPPPLVVEVASKRTKLYDRNRKKDVYEGFGIPAYWIVEPDQDHPQLFAFELRDGKYELVSAVGGDEQFRAAQPFPVVIKPSALVRTGRLG
jgi:Uma2 family endonuclease